MLVIKLYPRTLGLGSPKLCLSLCILVYVLLLFLSVCLFLYMLRAYELCVIS